MAKAFEFDGSTFVRAATLGNLLGSKLTIYNPYFKWGGGSGTLYSQCTSLSSNKEFQLFENGGNLWLSAGGASNEFGSVASIFGATTFEGELLIEVDFVNATMTITLNSEVVFNQAINVGTSRLNGVNFRIGARGDQNTSVSDGGGFFAPAGTVVGNTLISINDTPVRSYISDGVGSTWEETLSDSEGTVVGTTSWVDYGDTISIISPNVTKVFNWNANTLADVDFTVNFSGSPTGLERSIDGGLNWQSVSTSPTSPFSETVQLSAGMYDVRYRFSNDVTISDSVNVGVGPVIALIGHSNIVQYGDNNQVLQPSVNGVKAYMFGLDGGWKEAQDPIHSAAGIQYSVGEDTVAGGSAWILFANRWLEDNPNIPIAFIPCAKGGTQASDWTYSTSTGTLYGAMRARISAAADNNVDSFMCGFGGNEARFDVSYTDLRNTLNSIASSIQSNYNAPMYFMPLQNYQTANRPDGDGRTNGKIAMSSAILDFVASRNDCFVWGSVFHTDLLIGPNADGVHFRTDEQIADLFSACYSSYIRGKTQCELSIPSAADGIYTLTLSSGGYSAEYPVYVESGTANTSGFELDPGTAISGQITDGSSTFLLNGLVGGVLAAEVINQAPTSDAGPDQSVAAGVEFILDGTGSQDTDGAIVEWRWTQTAGDPVILDTSIPSQPRATSPSRTAAQTLTFQLITVDDEGEESAPSTVNVNVAAVVLSEILKVIERLDFDLVTQGDVNAYFGRANREVMKLKPSDPTGLALDADGFMMLDSNTIEEIKVIAEGGSISSKTDSINLEGSEMLVRLGDLEASKNGNIYFSIVVFVEGDTKGVVVSSKGSSGNKPMSYVTL